MTLLEILDNLLLECGIGTETSYAGNSDEAVSRLVSIANRASVAIVGEFPWSRLRRTYTFTMEDGVTEYDLPDDFERLIPDTAYANSYVVPMDMQTDEQQWAYLKVNGTGTGPRYRCRIFDGKIQVHAPQASEEVRLEYVSNAPVLASDGSRKRRFTADSDTYLLDDELLLMGAKWRYKQLIGQADWQGAMAEFQGYLLARQGADGGLKTIDTMDRDYPWGEPYTDTWVNNP